MFNNNYKLDNYAVRSFFINPLIRDLQKSNYKVVYSKSIDLMNRNIICMSNKVSYNAHSSLFQPDIPYVPYVFLTNVNIVPFDSLIISDIDKVKNAKILFEKPSKNPIVIIKKCLILTMSLRGLCYLIIK